MSERHKLFPLFPLGIVVLPSEPVPLHIFEERYKIMIRQCIAGGGEFGILWQSDAGLRETGCTLAITDLLDEMEDGRLNILCRGETPFRLVRQVEDRPYPAGEVELLQDEHGADPGPEGAEARSRYADLVERVTGERPSANALGALGAYEMAAMIELGLEDKQGLLEIRSEPERMRALSRLIEGATGRLEFAEAASERARTNGHVRRPDAS